MEILLMFVWCKPIQVMYKSIISGFSKNFIFTDFVKVSQLSHHIYPQHVFTILTLPPYFTVFFKTVSENLANCLLLVCSNISCVFFVSGLPRNLENLENLEKGYFFDKVRENLEKSGKKVEKAWKSGKSQGIFLYYLCVSVVCIKLRVLARILRGNVLLIC